MPTTGVFPVHNNIFKVGIKGRASTDSEMVMIKDLENFAPAIDGNTEEWSSMDQAGWTRRAVTGKSLSFSFSAANGTMAILGNDYVAGLMLGTGTRG
ncbi:phage tail tube protein [Paenibacillus sp. 1A_MP2]|uniref:phage tail tube protein n=1 Tax=Paenibacillus sp. 1A_MP2 TaxID=3457495 RepID=UPI003FCEE009